MLDDSGAVDNELNCGVFRLRWGKGEKCDGYANSGQDPESGTQWGLRGQAPSGTPISTPACKTDRIVRVRQDGASGSSMGVGGNQTTVPRQADHAPFSQSDRNHVDLKCR